MTEQRRRARELGVTIGSYPTGAHNAITDVPGVAVGQVTLNWGDGSEAPGHGPARSGVTVIWPHQGDILNDPVAAGCFILAGTGELTSRSVIEELGLINTPIALTGTMQVGLVYDALLRYFVERDAEFGLPGNVTSPVVGECDDSFLHDTRGAHLTAAHVFEALDSASTGPVAEGCVGGGMGMHSFEFKGGIGTSSRVLSAAEGGWTVGVLTQTNFGRRSRLTFAGVPLGPLFPTDDAPVGDGGEQGSGIIVVATDAPLDGRQLSRLARRAALGLGRVGSYGGHGSGELLLAFSTSYRPGGMDGHVLTTQVVEGDAVDPLFAATVDATEESVLNALCMATTTVGRFGNTRPALPLERTRAALVAAGRVAG